MAEYIDKQATIATLRASRDWVIGNTWREISEEATELYKLAMRHAITIVETMPTKDTKSKTTGR